MPKTLLHWHTPEENAGNPLVLLHGFMGCGTDWRGVAEALPEFGCYCPDLPGHGASHSADALALPDIEAVTEAIVRDLGALGIERCGLLGYSMGGRVALHLALQAPKFFEVLVLESASPGIESEDERKQRFLADAVLAERLRGMAEDRDAFHSFLQGWYATPIFCTMRDNPALDGLVASRLALGSAHLADALGIMGVGKQRNLWPELAKITVPTLVITGEKDRKYRQISERMAEKNPNFAVQIFSGCSHNVHWENVPGYTTALRAFLSRA